MNTAHSKIIAVALVILALLGLPLVVENYYLMHLIITFLIWSIYSSSYNILLNTGQLSMAHNALFAVGGYCSAILMMKLNMPFVVSMFSGALLSMAFGMFIGKITIKMRSSHFVLVTFAFAEITRVTANNWTSVTNGPNGIRNIPGPEIFGQAVNSMPLLYYMALFLVGLAIYVSWRMLYGRFGRIFIALRTSEDLAEAVGISHARHIMIAIAASCFLTGLGGSFYAHYVSLVSPELAKFGYMVNVLIMVIAGGRYTLFGPVLGAALFVFFTEFLRMFDLYRMLIFGVMLIFIVMYMPQGIYPVCVSRVKRLCKHWSV